MGWSTRAQILWPTRAMKGNLDDSEMTRKS